MLDVKAAVTAVSLSYGTGDNDYVQPSVTSDDPKLQGSSGNRNTRICRLLMR